jgi:sarcosine oxidase
VVGLGLVGAAALRHASAAGLRCVGIGPGEPENWPNHQGVFASHYDSGRITRRLDKQREWAVLADRAIAEYAGIEASSGISFHRPVGVVMAEVDASRLAATLAVAAGLRVAYERCEPGEAPGDARIALPSDATVLLEPAPAGFIDPRRMLAAQLAVARHNGADVLDAQVVGIESRPTGGWLVHTIDGDPVEAEQVVIATGPHADELAGLPLRPLVQVLAETVVLARVSGAELRRLAALPSIIVDDPRRDHLYIVPPTDYPDGHHYVKLGATRWPERVLSAPERRDWMAGSTHEADLDWLKALMLDVLPGLQADAWLTKPCLIPETPTKLPYVELVEPGCVMAVGSNGYAAKSADAIGALAVGLVIHGTWTDGDLDPKSFELISAST